MIVLGLIAQLNPAASIGVLWFAERLAQQGGQLVLLLETEV